MDPRLHTHALSRGGVFTSTQAAQLDVDDTALRRLERDGQVVRVRRDAYVLGESWSVALPEARLALRTRAVLAGRPGDVATHQSALALHGLPLHGLPLDTVDLEGDVSRVRLRSGLRTHPRQDGRPHVVVDGYRALTVEDALAQVLVRSGLLPALVPLDAALHEGRADLEPLSAALEETCRTPRQLQLGALLLGTADPGCESVGETRTRLLLLDAGMEVRSQVEVWDGALLVGRVDLLVGSQVVVEFDGALKYEGARGREALVAEKRREDALRALGYVVIRVTWADLERPERLVARVRRAMAQLHARGARLPAS